MPRASMRKCRQVAESDDEQQEEVTSEEEVVEEEKTKEQKEYEERLKNIRGLLKINDAEEAVRLALAIESKWKDSKSCKMLKKLKKQAEEAMAEGKMRSEKSPILSRILLDGTIEEMEELEGSIPKFRESYGGGRAYTYILVDDSLLTNVPRPGLPRFRRFVDSIIYIGKGQDKRPLAHLTEAVHLSDADLPIHSRKTRKIRTILDNGGRVGIIISSKETDGNGAFALEHSMILTMGLKSLTNKSNGGPSVKTNRLDNESETWPDEQFWKTGLGLLYEASKNTAVQFFSAAELKDRPELHEDLEDCVLEVTKPSKQTARSKEMMAKKADQKEEEEKKKKEAADKAKKEKEERMKKKANEEKQKRIREQAKRHSPPAEPIPKKKKKSPPSRF